MRAKTDFSVFSQRNSFVAGTVKNVTENYKNTVEGRLELL